MLKTCSTVAALALIAVLGTPAGAQSPPAWTQAGMLRCVVNPSIGFIIAGHQSMECRFTQNSPIPPQAYEGALNMIGLNIGITAGGVFAWAVLAPTVGLPAGALAGEYVGASGDIGLGVGAGANVLVGGSARTFALQPISLEGSVAVDVALGVSALKLRPVY
jgi:ABC-type amino acid transport substrate-binding protein